MCVHLPGEGEAVGTALRFQATCRVVHPHERAHGTKCTAISAAKCVWCIFPQHVIPLVLRQKPSVLWGWLCSTGAAVPPCYPYPTPSQGFLLNLHCLTFLFLRWSICNISDMISFAAGKCGGGGLFDRWGWFAHFLNVYDWKDAQPKLLGRRLSSCRFVLQYLYHPV